MKKDIHPVYHPKAKIKCACGHSFEVGSTQEAIDIDVCSSCHPFFTGKQNLVDTAKRVEKFQARAAKKTETVRKKSAKLKTKAEKRKPKVEVETAPARGKKSKE